MRASVIVLFCLLVNSTICLAQTKQTSKGNYTILRTSTSAQDGGIITGTIKELKTNRPLKVGVISINKDLITTDTLGHFRYEIPPGKYSIRAGFIGYYRIDIAKLKVQKQETVDITFYVKEDDRLL
jgi:uncharacterized membrane protein